MDAEATGIAAIITALLTPLTVIAVAWLQGRKVDKVAATTKETLRQTVQVNHAVNGRGTGDSTLSEDVVTIMNKQEVDMPTPLSERAPEDALLPQMKRLVEKVEMLYARLGQEDVEVEE